MTRKRRPNFRAEEKVSILRRVLLDHQPVSDVCEQHGIQPSQFYTWQKQLFEGGGAAFTSEADRERRRMEQTIDELKVRLARKDEVIATITEEHITLKKSVGSSDQHQSSPPDP